MTLDAAERAELEYLRLATRLSGANVWSWELAGGGLANAVATFVNLAETRGYEPGEAPTTFEEVLCLTVVPEDRSRVLRDAQAYLDGKTAQFECEYRVRHEDGSVRWNLARGVAVRDPSGRPLRFTGTSVDVTRLKQVEEDARVANERLELAAELSGFAVTEIDLRAADPERAKVTDAYNWDQRGLHPVTTPTQDDFRRAIAPEDLPRMLDAFRASVSGASPELHIEYRARNPHDDGFHWRLGRGKCFYDENGAPVRYIAVSHDIQQIKTAQGAARRAVQQLRLATDLSGVGVWGYELSPDGDLAQAKSMFDSDGVMLSLGYDLADVEPTLVARLGAVVYPDDQPRMQAALQDVFTGNTPMFDAECRFVAKDGSLRWKLVRGLVTRDAAGRPVAFMGTAVDIAQLKQTQEELRRVKDRLELAVSGSKACTWDFELVDGDFAGARVAFTNYWELLGYDGPPLGAESLSAIIEHAVAPGDRASLAADLQVFLDRRGHEWEREGRMLCKDGTEQWQLSRGVVARDAAGALTRFTGASIDITDRKLTEKALQDSEERFRRTFENAAVCMILIDLQGRFLEYNARFCEFLGYSRDELAGRSFIEFMAPDEVAQDLAQLARVVRGEIPSFTRDKRYFRKDGEVVWGNITVSVIQRLADGTPAHVMGILQDITERKQIESEVQRAREAAEAANRAKDEFLANVSHEIRTPMNAILGMTELAIDAAPSEHQRQLLSTVRSAAKNLLTIINDLLDFSKIASGKLTLDRADFSLRAAIGDTLRALAVRAHRKGLELLCRVHPDVPDALDGDAGRLRQVLMNLVGNAIKFTSRGEVEVNVEAEPSSGPSVPLIFTVRDTGIGIARDKQAAIFRAFEQEDSSTTRKYGGTGLGLTISAQLASLMGGGITVQSAPGCGSTFRFTARFARSARPDSVTVSPERLANLRVLVVDDHETNRRILVEWLTSWRMQPTSASDAAQALAALASAHAAGAPFSLVLLDARMPDIDGVTLAGEIRRRWEAGAPRLILLSSEDSAELSALAHDNGVLAYLLKPVQQSELLEAIWAVMNLEPTVPASAGPAGGQPERSRPLRVLVAEDNELNVTLLKELLRQRGHLAQFARDGRAALELALQGEFDLMLLDLHMPELDGLEVVRALRDLERGTNQHLRVIALTARSSARDRERCLAAGMDEFLAKPIEAAALWAAIERLVAAWPLAAPAPRPAEQGLLDARAILRASGAQATVLEKLRVVFRRTLPAQVARVRAALASGDLQQLRDAAHQLVGTVGAFSTITAGVASTLEDAAIREDRESCATLVDRLGALCDALLEATETLSIDSLSL
jgi:two-component system sensor histidine kinase/response regulator